MCLYCENEKILLKGEFVDDWIFNLCKEVKSNTITYSNYGVYIDRGYLRFVDMEDNQCLDHGQKIKINFCPFCGEKQCL